MTTKPKVIRSKVIYSNPYLDIKIDTLELNNNTWEQAIFIKPNKNGVGILALDETGIYLVRQYRHASGGFFWQIPMGMMDKGAEELQTAKYELEEETGLAADKYEKIGSFNAEPGMSNQQMFIYAATGFRKVGQKLEVSEAGMKVKHFTFIQIKQMVKAGKIKCGFTLSALYLLHNRDHFAI